MDIEKPAVMNDFRKTLNKEANDVQVIIEKHVRTKLGLNKPTREVDSQTLTYDRVKDKIIEEMQHKLEKKITERIKSVNDIKVARLEGEIADMLKEKKNMKQKFLELQRKMTTNSEEGILEELKRKVSYFFKRKLGKK